jgi:hypothetical protein
LNKGYYPEYTILERPTEVSNNRRHLLSSCCGSIILLRAFCDYFILLEIKSVVVHFQGKAFNPERKIIGLLLVHQLADI